MLYKCIPDDIQLPEFLVPYKSYGVGFNKCKINKFVLFKFVEWDEKHPQGLITEVLGDIDNFDTFKGLIFLVFFLNFLNTELAADTLIC